MIHEKLDLPQDLKIGSLLGEGEFSRTYSLLGSDENLVIKLYHTLKIHPLSLAKGSTLLENFNGYNGTSPQLRYFMPEGLGFSVDMMAPESPAIAHTWVPGKELSTFNDPFTQDQVASVLSNAIGQLMFVEQSKPIAIPQNSGLNINTLRVDYHGDISDTSLLISPEGTSALVDWDACLNQELDLVTAHPIYAAPETWAGDATDEGLSPHLVDAYGLGGVIARMFLGEKFYDCLVHFEERGKFINNPAILDALQEQGVEAEIVTMVGNLLSEEPESRMINGAKTAKENLQNILATLKK